MRLQDRHAQLRAGRKEERHAEGRVRPKNTLEGKRWDQLAYEAYGDPLAYERIFRANPAFGVSLFLPAGAELRVPVLE
ncbi:MAG: tail protein X, partial [Candidatus Methylomirabilis sp.]|nr:tail protein X [Deltaproteobacteria bacterium]